MMAACRGWPGPLLGGSCTGLCWAACHSAPASPKLHVAAPSPCAAHLCQVVRPVGRRVAGGGGAGAAPLQVGREAVVAVHLVWVGGVGHVGDCGQVRRGGGGVEQARCRTHKAQPGASRASSVLFHSCQASPASAPRPPTPAPHPPTKDVAAGPPQAPPVVPVLVLLLLGRLPPRAGHPVGAEAVAQLAPVEQPVGAPQKVVPAVGEGWGAGEHGMWAGLSHSGLRCYAGT